MSQKMQNKLALVCTTINRGKNYNYVHDLVQKCACKQKIILVMHWF